MSPYIFPGTKPTAQLYFDIQAMIDDNGGRLKLADALESEMVKPFSYKYKNYRGLWSQSETDLLKENYKNISAEKLMLLIDRPLVGINNKIYRMLVSGELVRKTKKRKRKISILVV